MVSTFATPSPKHERIPKGKRYCTNCRTDVEVSLGDASDVACPVCHEQSLLPKSESQRHDRKGV